MAHVIVAGDIGRRFSKFYCDGRMVVQSSIVGEYRELKSERPLTQHEGVMCYRSRHYFLWDLAASESEYPIQNSVRSKVHEQTLLLGIAGMHGLINDGDDVTLIVSHPIEDHTPAKKQAMRELFLGEHFAVVNGVAKSWRVSRCEITPEGAVAIWSLDHTPDYAHIIDAGSRTVNYAVMVNRGLYDKLSGTLDFGCDTVRNINPRLFADTVAAQLSRRWLKQLGPVYVVGGMASLLAPEFQRHFTDVRTLSNSQMASAIGMYNLGVYLVDRQAATNQ